METAIGSIPNGNQLLLYESVRRHLFYLGGVPRWVTEYILLLLKEIERIPSDDSLTIESIENAYFVIRNLYIDTWGKGLKDIDFVKLTAYAISEIEVSESSQVINNMSWARVRDSSLCLLTKRYEVNVSNNESFDCESNVSVY